MTEVSERYARLADAFAAKVAAVSPDQWSAPTPCENWTVRGLVEHVVSSQGIFLGFVGESVGDAPSVDDDPRGAWTAARTVVQRGLDDPERAASEFEGMMGRMTFEGAVDRFLSVDLVVHGWDLSRAAGLDDRIDPRDIAHVRAAAESFGDAMRNPRAFGPEVQAPPGADEQAKLMAFLGRTAGLRP
jgi:uncharacterized protein (TIGR03086 family)